MRKIQLSFNPSQMRALIAYLDTIVTRTPHDILERLQHALLIEVHQKLTVKSYIIKDKTKISLSYPQAAALWLNLGEGKWETYTATMLISLSQTIHPQL